MKPLLTRTGIELRADPTRVVARLFVPGNEIGPSGRSRADAVLHRVLALDEDTVVALLSDVRARWGPRHRDLHDILCTSYEHVRHRIPTPESLSADRQALVGAYFTQELAIEGAALLNPSVVRHPDQSGCADGDVRFVMSLRAVGEGHISSVELRSGTLTAAGEVLLDPVGPHVETGRISHTTYERGLFAAGMLTAGADEDTTAYLMSLLPATFDLGELHHGLLQLVDSEHSRHGPRTDDLARELARCTYRVDFDEATGLAERVLRPHGPTETMGLEDARFVRMVEDDGRVVHRATYTAFDGRHIAPQLIQTDDFRSFRISVLAGPAAVDKGMALFPRRIDGRYVALTRADRETTGLTTSDNGYWWGPATPLLGPGRPWDAIQTGNCGSPVETDAGWLVLTHGVGPMREYSLGAILLDLHDPTRVLGELAEPLLRPQQDEREGYVPNVVYSCGAMRHGDLLLLPYGVSDAAVRFAVVDLPQLLERLTDGAPR